MRDEHTTPNLIHINNIKYIHTQLPQVKRSRVVNVCLSLLTKHGTEIFTNADKEFLKADSLFDTDF